MVLCSFFPRADSGSGGLNAVLRIKVILLNPFPPVLRHFSKSRGASVRPFPRFESTCACARFYIWYFPDCFSIMHCVLPRLPSVNGVSLGMGVCNSKRTSFRAGTAGAFRVAACDVTQTPPAPAGGGAERSRRRANGAEKAGSGEAVEGECRRREAERCAQVRSFCRKAPRFSSFYGDFCDKVRTFFLSVALFRAINRGEAPINGDENEAESARMYIRGVKNW